VVLKNRKGTIIEKTVEVVSPAGVDMRQLGASPAS
jgi:hypothetical protein